MTETEFTSVLKDKLYGKVNQKLTIHTGIKGFLIWKSLIRRHFYHKYFKVFKGNKDYKRIYKVIKKLKA